MISTGAAAKDWMERGEERVSMELPVAWMTKSEPIVTDVDTERELMAAVSIT